MFSMQNCKPARTPMEANLKFEKSITLDDTRRYPYQNLIEAFMYLSVMTRTDIAYAVNYLSQYNSGNNLDHWKAAKRILRYLKGTSEYGLLYH